MMAERRRAEGGFTLVELLVAISVLGIILLPLGAAFVIGYQTTDQTSARLGGSSDAQFLQRYLAADIKSADAGTTNPATCSGVTNGKLQLTSNAYPASGTAILPVVVIVYWTQMSGSGFQLVRSICTNTPTVPPPIVVARNLLSLTSVTVTPIDTTRGYTVKITEKKAVTDKNSSYSPLISGRFRSRIPT